MDAIKNLDNEYLMVGLVEDMETSYALLEKFLPQYFKGLTSLPKSEIHNDLSHKVWFYKCNILEQVNSGRKDPNAIPMTTQSADKLREILALEYELYNFAVQRFHRQVEEHLK